MKLRCYLKISAASALAVLLSSCSAKLQDPKIEQASSIKSKVAEIKPEPVFKKIVTCTEFEHSKIFSNNSWRRVSDVTGNYRAYLDVTDLACAIMIQKTGGDNIGVFRICKLRPELGTDQQAIIGNLLIDFLHGDGASEDQNIRQRVLSKLKDHFASSNVNKVGINGIEVHLIPDKSGHLLAIECLAPGSKTYKPPADGESLFRSLLLGCGDAFGAPAQGGLATKANLMILTALKADSERTSIGESSSTTPSETTPPDSNPLAATTPDTSKSKASTTEGIDMDQWKKSYLASSTPDQQNHVLKMGEYNNALKSAIQSGDRESASRYAELVLGEARQCGDATVLSNAQHVYDVAQRYSRGE